MEKEPVTQTVYCLVNNKGEYYQSWVGDEACSVTWWATLPTEGRLFENKQQAEKEKEDKGIEGEIYKIILKPELIQ